MERVLRRSRRPSRGHAARAGHLHAARRESAHHRRARRARVRRHAHGRLRRGAVVHVLSGKPPDPAGSGPDDQRSRRRVLLRCRARHGRACRSHRRQQHALGDCVLRHIRHVEEGVQHRLPCRARAGAGPLPDARGQDRGRQRRGVSGAASVLFSARLLVEPRVPVASLLARPRRSRRSAAARRELAVLPVGQRASRTRAAHGRVLPRVRRDTGSGAVARAALHEPRSIPGASPATRR